ncbi:hypothetical protein OQZ33_03990 [Pedobacter sp. MC2016-05]|uniref:hypothetical protein n=1 Tax=Pedobacter sp. MC2016-05 TaxID=2994474 RepID=UPI002247F835|nr:hypothetical protein [Pedobacter sp. MC2016-05]MCX2473486.1 hypothetical protein [Pedobacter sp. MC2016-05]
MINDKYYNRLRVSLMVSTFIFLLYPNSLSAQNKIEREFRIKPGKVPKSALNYVTQLFPAGKIKWYVEKSESGESIEAKIKTNRTIYSIEFDRMGKLQDIETIVSFDSLPEKVRGAINEGLKSKFMRIKILKVQRQWSGSPETLQLLLAGKNSSRNYMTRYEIVLRGINIKSTSDYEVLFDDQGRLVKILKIINQNNPHLLY